MHADEKTSVYELKAHVENILRRLGVNMKKLTWSTFSNDIYTSGMTISSASGRTLGTFGVISRKILKKMDIDDEVYFAELLWSTLMKETRKAETVFVEIPKFPEVKRDLALLVDQSVTFEEIERIAFETERKLLKKVTLFDVYEGSKLLPGKKS